MGYTRTSATAVVRCASLPIENLVFAAVFKTIHNNFFAFLLVQVVLHFTVPVTVDTAGGSPVLLLRMDPTTTDTRSAEYIPGLTQFVDVGVDASR